jgi:divalent metal cation (Fe/Co/Zn/Cd) transporter
MSIIMLPVGSVTGSPAPIAAAIGSSTSCTSPIFILFALSLTARRSTCVLAPGGPD